MNPLPSYSALPATFGNEERKSLRCTAQTIHRRHRFWILPEIQINKDETEFRKKIEETKASLSDLSQCENKNRIQKGGSIET